MKKPAVFALGFASGAFLVSTCVSAWAWTQMPHTARTPKSFANAELDRVPFDGQWLVFWGGDSRQENRHVGAPPQDRAMDIIGPGDDTASKSPRKNEDYACWGKPILSPISGVVVAAIDGIADNAPGQTNRHIAHGNSMLIKSDRGFVVALSHFKSGSVARRVGDRVVPGDLLGLCGNSGNSTLPHLHMHVQSETSYASGEALRPVFKSLRVGADVKANYAPHKGDLISPVTAGI